MERWGIRIGDQVDIKRTDGRVHGAIVSGYNEATQSFSVEWFENDETKGKEIEATVLLALNPQYNDRQSQASLEQDYLPRPNAPRRKPSKESMQDLRDVPSYRDLHKEPRDAPAGRPSRVSRPESPREKRRVSRCVQEVEKLKKNREERRAKQSEEMQRRQQEEEESGENPNWDFLQMVRQYRAELGPPQGFRLNEPIEQHKICVAIRKRPLNKKETTKKDVDVITVPNKSTVLVHEPKVKVDLTKYLENHQYTFDYAFDESASNELVYKYTTQPLVETIFEEGFATCFAYGQTGSGKTYTMGGNLNIKAGTPNGIYASAARDIFRLAQSPKYQAKDLKIYVSFFEIYGGKVFDLLDKRKKLRVLEDGQGQVQVVGLQQKSVTAVEQVFKVIREGNAVRTTGVTSANSDSSRSHAVFQIVLKKGLSPKPFGKFSLIDLAGNER
eukprot:Colp12_sorted_trinity150504_noHs@13085